MDTHPAPTSGPLLPPRLVLRGARDPGAGAVADGLGADGVGRLEVGDRAELVAWPADDVLELSAVRQHLGRRSRRLWT